MGCQLAKENDRIENDKHTNTKKSTVQTMASESTNAVDYKSRLEWKICVAKDTPEPEFDLSECNLKDVPSGVFVLCRVLLKERLKLQKNQLQSLNHGGNLADLANLKLLDLSHNLLLRLPDNFYASLKNLRELFLSHNHLDRLPDAIKNLFNLELLDISYNQFTSIDQINCMPRLRILNINGNAKLRMLPATLSTCDSLVDIVVDVDNILYPPRDVVELGTREILNYLIVNGNMNGSEFIDHTSKTMPLSPSNIVAVTKNFICEERGISAASNRNIKEKKFIENERVEQEKYTNLEANLHLEQMKRKKDFLQQLLQQQNESDSIIHEMQKKKDVERQKLIDDILKDEQKAGIIVDKLLSLKCGPDSALLEKEQEEQKQLLEQLRINYSDLRKRDVLAAMTELLEYETKQIGIHNEKRDSTSRTLLENEMNTNHLLYDLFKANDKDRMAIVKKITQDEELQKAAFARLIEKNDARTWGLVEQVRIVESQLATMTNYEIERKKLQLDDRIVDLSEQRIKLTYILLDLLDQQAARKKELCDTLVCLELQKEREQQDFWLLQYQKLLDAQPTELSLKSSTIDPLLGYYFLINEVVHCIPFLSKLWQSTVCNIEDITDDDLIAAGIKRQTDRMKILKSIKDFVYQQQQQQQQLQANSKISPQLEHNDQIAARQPSAQCEPETTSLTDTCNDLASECVICMEELCKVILLPCGHLCCCLNCQNLIEDCPMCRAKIERRIKIIQA